MLSVSSSAWGNLGNVLKSQGKMAEAEKAYRNALYYRSNMADMLYNLGLLLQENNRFSEALHYYKLAIGSRPTLASAYLNTGIILMNQGRLDEAKRTFLTCAEIPDENLKDPHAHKSSVTSCLYNLGKLLHEQGKHEGQKLEAERYFLKAIQLDPSKGSCYMHYGQFLLEDSRFLEAAEMAEKAAQLDSMEFDVVFNAAHMLRQASLNEAAEKYYRRAAGLRSNALDKQIQKLLSRRRYLRDLKAQWLDKPHSTTEVDVSTTPPRAAQFQGQVSFTPAPRRCNDNADEDLGGFQLCRRGFKARTPPSAQASIPIQNRFNPLHVPSLPSTPGDVIVVGDLIVQNLNITCPNRKSFVSCYPGARVRDVTRQAPTIYEKHKRVVGSIILHAGVNDIRHRESEVLQADFTA
ncbi:TMTC2 protein, partial [Polypterus senegalus]